MSQSRPNIVFILTDDQGPWAMGCAGNPEIRTPCLDALAAGGVRFENFFCTSPVCSPARASIMTGRMPSAHGVHDWLRGDQGADAFGDYLAGLPCTTDVLSAAGYRVGLSGKWHMGIMPEPRDGLEHWFCMPGGSSQYNDAEMYRDGRLVTCPGYLTDVITDDAVAFLDAQHRHGQDGRATHGQDARATNAHGRDARATHGQDARATEPPGRPFYLSVHYNAPHAPWTGHPRDIVDSYDACPFESCPQEPPHPWLRPDLAGRLGDRESLKGYFAAVTAMDANVGRIVAKIEQMGLTEETLIAFMSDNGFSCGHHGFWGKGNGTFPMNMVDNSVKVPCIVRQPGRVPAGRVSPAMLSQVDVMPTLLEWAGLDRPADPLSPGVSFADVLAGQASEVREEVVVYDEYGPVRMIRTPEIKYVHRYPYGPHELYDLTTDPDERANLIDERSRRATVSEMRRRLAGWFERYVDARCDGVGLPVNGHGQTRRLRMDVGIDSFFQPDAVNRK